MTSIVPKSYRVELCDFASASASGAHSDKVTIKATVGDSSVSTIALQGRGWDSIDHQEQIEIKNNGASVAVKDIRHDKATNTFYIDTQVPLTAGDLSVKLRGQLRGAESQVQIPVLPQDGSNAPTWQLKLTSHDPKAHCRVHGSIKTKEARDRPGHFTTTFAPQPTPPAAISARVAQLQQSQFATLSSATISNSTSLPNFGDFMKAGWEAQLLTPPAAILGAKNFQARRLELSKRFPGEVLIVPTGPEKVRANDTYYLFRPGTDFYYLTGCQEPDCVLVLVPSSATTHEAVLLVAHNMGRTDTSFFNDRKAGELWVGPRLGIAQSKFHFGVERCEPLSQFANLAEKLKAQYGDKIRMVRGIDANLDSQVVVQNSADKDKELAEFLSEQRLIKDDLEIAALREACAATKRGFEDVIAKLPTAKSEREVEGAFNTRARVEGNGVGYNTIAAAGTHACILHWSRNTGELKPGELLLLDAGVESNQLYTADVTRTLPISGQFTKAQRQVYDLVCAAQAAGIAQVKPGNDFRAPHRAAMRVLTEGLIKLGILSGSVDDILKPEHRSYARYSLHGTSHMLGIDVHDCDHARESEYDSAVLKPGMVLTVEPGLYFQVDDATVPAEFRGIGVRIEDDIVVTQDGCEILSTLPREADAVEQWMQSIWKTASVSQKATAI